jgi:hypothetical protein
MLARGWESKKEAFGATTRALPFIANAMWSCSYSLLFTCLLAQTLNSDDGCNGRFAVAELVGGSFG